MSKEIKLIPCPEYEESLFAFIEEFEREIAKAFAIPEKLMKPKSRTANEFYNKSFHRDPKTPGR